MTPLYSDSTLGSISDGRNGPLTRMIRSARTHRMRTEPGHLPVTKIREALLTGVALEELEAERGQPRFRSWLGRTFSKAAKQASYS